MKQEFEKIASSAPPIATTAGPSLNMSVSHSQMENQYEHKYKKLKERYAKLTKNCGEKGTFIRYFHMHS